MRKTINIGPLLTKVAIGAGAVILGLNSFFTTSEGFQYFVQNKMTGGTSVYSEPGIHFQMPFFTKVTEYKRVATIDATEAEGDYTRDLLPFDVTFADTYTAAVPATFRYRLPADEENFRKLHSEFRSFSNLVDALLIANSKNVAVVTATQYTGEEFIQGGVNAFKAQMEDQLQAGLYVTKRQQVEVTDSGYAPVSSQNSNANLLQEKQRLVWKNVVQYDTATGQPKRLANPLAEYGIQVSQVTIGRPLPDEKLDSLLERKRELVGEKISAEQEIETNRTKAEAGKQEREIEKQKAIQDAQKEKELAIIAQQKEVEVERQIALKELVQQQKQKDVAVVQKEKELEISKSNRAIQEANAIAAKFEAQAILEKGLAEAQVEEAKLLAKQSAKDIYLAEVQRDIAKVLYPNLKDVEIKMPQFYMTGGSDGDSPAPNSLDVYTTLGAKSLLDNMNNQAQ
jgi:regulator of protease activity HflC (stomatin/prohibitin superfamily)